jgi:TonB family protein
MPCGKSGRRGVDNESSPQLSLGWGHKLPRPRAEKTLCIGALPGLTECSVLGRAPERASATADRASMRAVETVSRPASSTMARRRLIPVARPVQWRQRQNSDIEGIMRPLLAALGTVCLVTLSLSAQTTITANEPVYDSDDGVSQPRVTKPVYVNYSSRAMRENVRGTIKLKCVVSSDGTTRDVELVSGLEQQMDANAVAALKHWKFEPGQRERMPVAVRITVDMTFRCDESNTHRHVKLPISIALAKGLTDLRTDEGTK